MVGEIHGCTTITRATVTIRIITIHTATDTGITMVTTIHTTAITTIPTAIITAAIHTARGPTPMPAVQAVPQICLLRIPELLSHRIQVSTMEAITTETDGIEAETATEEVHRPLAVQVLTEAPGRPVQVLPAPVREATATEAVQAVQEVAAEDVNLSPTQKNA